MPQTQRAVATPPPPPGTYDFGDLGSVSGLKINGRYATADEARNFLISHRMDLMGGAPTQDTTPPPDSIPGGILRRGVGLAQGISSLIPDPAADAANPAAAVRRLAAPAVSFADAERRLAGQTRRQFKSGQPLKGSVSALSMLDPFATQTVADVNQLQEEGRGSEAAGAGLFDIFTLLPGLKGGVVMKKLAGGGERFPQQVNYLSRATGIDPVELQKVATGLNTEARLRGIPNTVESLGDLVTSRKRAVDNRFNILLQPHRSLPVIPIQIAQELGQLAHSPGLVEAAAAGDAEARATIAYLNRQVIRWQRPYSLGALNDMRSTASAQRAPFYEKSVERQGSKIRGDIDARIDQIVERGLKDTVYGALRQKYPGVDVRGLKAEQSALMSIESDIAERSKSLRTAQAERKGSTLREVKPSLYAHPGGAPSTSIHGLQSLIAGGPEKMANKAVTRAFPSTATRVRNAAGRAAAKAAPVAAAVAPKDRMKSFEAQLRIAKATKDKAWAARIEKLIAASKQPQEE